MGYTRLVLPLRTMQQSPKLRQQLRLLKLFFWVFVFHYDEKTLPRSVLFNMKEPVPNQDIFLQDAYSKPFSQVESIFFRLKYNSAATKWLLLLTNILLMPMIVIESMFKSLFYSFFAGTSHLQTSKFPKLAQIFPDRLH